MSRYTFTPAAEADLNGIWEFIAGDSIDSADRVIEDIYAAVERLADMPGIGHSRKDLGDESLRVWRVHSYLIVYRPALHSSEILRVVSGFRDMFMALVGE